jgi:hydroxypyruvate isomerase
MMDMPNVAPGPDLIYSDPMPRLAANLSWLFTEWDFLDRFAAAADAGFEAVEYLFPYDHDPDTLAARLARHGLKQVLFNAAPGDFAGGERGIAAFPERRAEFQAAFATAFTYAQATATPRIHVMAGVAAGPAALACYKDALRHACATAPDLDILIEPLNPKDAPGYLLDSFDLAAGLIAELKLPNLKLQFDIYHREMLDGDAIAGMDALLTIAGHVQVSSAPNRAEPGAREIAALRELDRLGYGGYVGCEYHPAAGTLAGLRWRDRL